MKIQTDVSTVRRKSAKPSKSSSFDYSKAPPNSYVNRRLREADLPGKFKREVWPFASVIAERMNKAGVCFVSRKMIAKEIGCSVSTVKRHLKKITQDGFYPLFLQSYPGETNGYQHQCRRFTLIRNPLEFAGSRDTLRKKINTLKKRGPKPLGTSLIEEEFIRDKGQIDADWCLDLDRGMSREQADHKRARRIAELEQHHAQRIPDGD